MFTHERLKPKKWDGRRYEYAHAKLDGHRVTFFKNEDGSLTAYGREVRPDLEMTRRFPRLADPVWGSPLVRRFKKEAPPRSSMDCEVWSPGRPASHVPTALREGSEPLQVTAFALPWWDGKDLEAVRVDKIRDDFRGLLWMDNDEFAELSSLEDLIGDEWLTSETVKFQEWNEHLVQLALAKGLEGYVLKSMNYLGWCKVKAEETVDCVCTGVEPGKGKYEGLVGSLEGSVYNGDELVVVANVSGMTDDERKAMSQSDAGRVFEVAYQYVGAKGKLRHPRFVRWRDDKPAKECTWDQLES